MFMESTEVKRKAEGKDRGEGRAGGRRRLASTYQCDLDSEVEPEREVGLSTSL